MRAHRSELLAGLVCSLLLLASGCNYQVTDVYGESDDYAARCSPGGNTVLRAMVEERGHRTYTVRSLSPANMERLNTLIWCPDDFPNHKKATLDWIETWLAKGDRTLVYIGRDFSPHAAYWSDIAAQRGTNPANRSEWLAAMDEIAGSQNEIDTKRRRCRQRIATPWCLWELRGGRMERVTSLRGDWSKGIDAEKTNIVIRSSILPLASKDVGNLKKELEVEIARRTTAPPTPPATPPNPTPLQFGVEDLESQQLDVLNAINQQTEVERYTLLADKDLQTLASVVESHPTIGSRVILINNNSLFCNHSMLRSSHRKIASAMIDSFSPGSVGFISGEDDPRIRSDNNDERQRGFEMLTVWPLNVVAIHAAFLGLAAMIAFFPIFGRPQRLRKASTADFGMHVEAIGSLMQKSGDNAYATQQIAEYFRYVRGDLVSPWANMQEEETKPQSPFRPSQPG